MSRFMERDVSKSELAVGLCGKRVSNDERGLRDGGDARAGKDGVADEVKIRDRRSMRKSAAAENIH